VTDGIGHLGAQESADEVQHRPEDDFSPFSIWLGDVDEPSIWGISVEITSPDMRKPQKATLRLEITLSKERQ
jgi:hypothetical protein